MPKKFIRAFTIAIVLFLLVYFYSYLNYVPIQNTKVVKVEPKKEFISRQKIEGDKATWDTNLFKISYPATWTVKQQDINSCESDRPSEIIPKDSDLIQWIYVCGPTDSPTIDINTNNIVKTANIKLNGNPAVYYLTTKLINNTQEIRIDYFINSNDEHYRVGAKYFPKVNINNIENNEVVVELDQILKTFEITQQE